MHTPNRIISAALLAATVVPACFAAPSIPDKPAETLASSQPAAPILLKAFGGFDFDETSSLGRVLRILAEKAGINYIEPELDPKEKIALTVRGMDARSAFFEVARRRGFEVRDRNGIVELLRDDAPSHGREITRSYVIHHVDSHLLLESVANFLGVTVTSPNAVSLAFPAPQASNSVGGSSGSNSPSSSGGSSSSGNNSSSSSSGGSSSSGNNSSGGSQGRWTPSIPFSSPLSQGGFKDSAFKCAVYLDRIGNGIVVRATEAQHADLAAYIASLDQTEPQVEITVKILEINVDKAESFGLDWSFSGSYDFGQIAAGSTAGAFTGSIASNLGGNTVLSNKQVSATLHALESHGTTSTVSEMRNVTRSGVPVFLNDSVETSIETFSSSLNSTSSANAQLQTGTQVFTTGVLGDVLARILDNGMIDLNVNPTVATQVGQTKGADGQQLPIIAKRNLTTSVLVKDGYTVIVGGLMQRENNITTSQTPLISRIPLVGNLFKTNSKTKSRSNLVILVTPHIIRGSFFQPGRMNDDDRSIISEADQDKFTLNQ